MTLFLALWEFSIKNLLSLFLYGYTNMIWNQGDI